MSNPPPVPAPSAENPAATAEAVRLAHIKHEASVRSIGLLYFLAAVILPLAAVGGLMAESRDTTSLFFGALFLVLTAIYILVGRWLRALDPRARTPTTILAAIGLLAFPLGTLINGYIIFLVQSAKGKMVFSPEYQAVIAATPHVKYKTSIVVWILLILLLVLLASAMIVPLIAK